MEGVFDGLRVLDLSWGTAGPMTTMLLSDGGAAVTRIERPDGDPFSSQSGYRVWNRGKKSIDLDLASTEGRDHARRLIRSADVLVEALDVRPGDVCLSIASAAAKYFSRRSGGMLKTSPMLSNP